MAVCRLAACTALLLAWSALSETASNDDQAEWWIHASIYQLYVPSFKDEDNSGLGDLRGIIQKADYLKETGFDAVALSPVCASPMLDFGYDVSDFISINPALGTMRDFEELVRILHKKGMKLIMDFVPNHSSDRHEWFERSVRREPGYEDYYVWKDPKGFDADGRPLPPNNWLSVFYGSAWTYREERKQFYLHQFGTWQPDLNMRCARVVEETKDILRFWMRKGVDGFRIDAVPFLFEDPQFRDEPMAWEAGDDPRIFEYLNHTHTQGLQENYEMVQLWRELIEEEDSREGGRRFLAVEAFAPIEQTMLYFGTEKRPGAHFPYNYNLLQNTDSGTTVQDIKRKINRWFDHLPKFGISNWMTGVHDQHRIGNKLGPDLINGMNVISLLLPGASVTYYGEEIGMVDNEGVAYEKSIDPQGRGYPKRLFRERSRDFERTPFQWDSTVNAGFNAGNKTWLPVNENYKTLNLEAQRRQAYSHYAIFTDLMKARKTRAVRDGTLLLRVVGRGTLGFVRGVSSGEYVVALVNFSHDDDAIDLEAEFLLKNRQLYVLTTDAHPGFTKGEEVDPTALTLPGRKSLVLVSKRRQSTRRERSPVAGPRAGR